MRRKMKKGKTTFCLILCIIMVLSSATAETEWKSLQELQAETTARWTETIETPWRTVSVDTPIELPSADHMPVFRVEYTKSIKPDLFEDYQLSENGLHTYDRGILHAERGKRVDALDNWDNVCLKSMRIYTREARDIRLSQYRNENTFYECFSLTDPLPNEKADHLSFSMTQAYRSSLAQIKRFYGGLAGEMKLTLAAAAGCYYQYSMKDGTKVLKAPVNASGFYDFEWHQTFSGIEYVWVEPFFRPCTDQSLFNPCRGRICVRTDGETFFSIMGSTITIRDKPYDDVPLRSFDMVKPQIKKLIMDGTLRYIDRIRLCYTGFYDPNDKNVLWLVPTWLISGDYCTHPEIEYDYPIDQSGQLYMKETTYDYVFPAQSIVMLHPDGNEKINRIVPDIMTWDHIR